MTLKQAIEDSCEFIRNKNWNDQSEKKIWLKKRGDGVSFVMYYSTDDSKLEKYSTNITTMVSYEDAISESWEVRNY